MNGTGTGTAEYTSQGRHWLRSVGSGVLAAAMFLMVANGGAFPPTPEVLWQAFLQFTVVTLGAFGITAATKPKE